MRRVLWAVLPLMLALPAAAERPVVLELFTSQGCSSCPPADALLGRLAERPGVLALAFHVDYWNRLGWRDPYADAAWTARQRAYAPRVSGSSWAGRVYTPQLVIDGSRDVVGSDAAGVEAALRRAAPRESVPIAVARDGATLAIRVEAGTGAARVYAAVVDPTRVTKVGRGENAGRNLTESRIVRRLASLGDWTGAALDLRAPDPRFEAGQSVVVLLQQPDGRYLGVAELAAN